jgi:hypothetical protein
MGGAAFPPGLTLSPGLAGLTGANMLKFRIHRTGEWTRNADDTSASREPPTVTEFESLAHMGEYDRKQFEWMMQIGESVTSCGEWLWEIEH